MNELTNLQAGSLIPDQTITADLFKSFIEYIDASPKTIESYSRALKQFARYLYSQGISKPERPDIVAYREYLKEDHKPTTVQTYITVVRLFFQWTAQEGIYPNIADHLKGAKLDKNHKKDYLTSKQVKRILGSMERKSEAQKRNYAMMALMITGGLRTIEVSRSNIEDLRTAGDSTVLYIQGKGHEEKADYIKICSEVEEAIRDYLAIRKEKRSTAPLFSSCSNNSTGQRLSTRSISGIVKQAFRSAGYDSDRLTAHSTRHTAVTLALLGGQSLQQVQQFARHTNITTTQIYAHNLDRAKNQCEAVIAKAIF